MFHPLLEEALEVKNMKLGLASIEEMDKKLGSPSQAFPSIHVAGTNGKGSVVTKLAAAYQAKGLLVGLYTSPHLISYRERIQVGGQPIGEKEADQLLLHIQQVVSPQLPTYFEWLTLLAFTYFAEKQVDIAIVEVGLGGRLDATNIIHPKLSIITSISRDHTQYLGESLEKIAQEKGGIIKPHTPVVIGPQAKPKAIFEKIAAEKESPLYPIEGKFAHYEEENCAIVHQALALLPYPYDSSVLETTRPKGRFELVAPRVIVDVGHNPDALERTFERIECQYPGSRVRVLAAFSADKEIEALLAILERRACAFHLTQADHPRAWKGGDPDFDQSFKKAYELAQARGEWLLICGTFFMMKRVGELLRLSHWWKQTDHS